MRAVVEAPGADDEPAADPTGEERDWRGRAESSAAADRLFRVGCIGVAGVLLLLLVVLVIVPVVRPDPNPWDSAECVALSSAPPGLEDGLRWSNTITSTSASWVAVLTDIPQIADDQRPQIAAAVRADDAGYQRVLALASADDITLAAVEHLHALAVDPERGAASITWDEGRDTVDPVTAEAQRAVHRLAGEHCPGLLF